MRGVYVYEGKVYKIFSICLRVSNIHFIKFFKEVNTASAYNNYYALGGVTQQLPAIILNVPNCYLDSLNCNPRFRLGTQCSHSSRYVTYYSPTISNILLPFGLAARIRQVLQCVKGSSSLLTVECTICVFWTILHNSALYQALCYWGFQLSYEGFSIPWTKPLRDADYHELHIVVYWKSVNIYAYFLCLAHSYHILFKSQFLSFS